MPAPRKIFRIEETAATQSMDSTAEAQATEHGELLAQIAALRASLAAMAKPAVASGAPPHAATARLKSELDLIAGAFNGSSGDARGGRSGVAGVLPSSPQLTRVAHELTEVVSSTERATQRVLAAAEAIDQVAANLSAALTGKFEQGLAQDIQDLVIQIFEACNFQDLAGQRVSKVLATLNFIEEHITRVLEEIKNPSNANRRDGDQHLHGPRLDSDLGHASQSDIDALFN